MQIVSLLAQIVKRRKMTQRTFEPDRVGSGQSDRPAASSAASARSAQAHSFPFLGSLSSATYHLNPSQRASASAQDRGCCIVFKEHSTSSKVLLVMIMGPCTKMCHRPRNRPPTLRVSCPPRPKATETEWIIRETVCRGIWRGFAHSRRTPFSDALIRFHFHS